VMHRWTCRLMPSLYSSDVGTCAFDFEARCFTDPFHGLEVRGEIECVRTPVTPRSLSGKLPTSWTSIPDITEGYGRLGMIFHDHGERHPGLFFTLFCNPVALQWIYQAFLAGFANPQRHFVMSITIESLSQEDVCLGDGQTEDWNVVAWELVMEREREDIGS
jgi:hypothetical protein